jgi:hypothetical protein
MVLQRRPQPGIGTVDFVAGGQPAGTPAARASVIITVTSSGLASIHG